MDKQLFTTIELAPTVICLAAETDIAVNTNDRTVTFTASDETPVDRFDWYNWEVYQMILSHDPKHVNLSRVKSRTCMFLEDHRSIADYELGQIKKAQLKDGKLTLTAKLHPTPKADLYLSKVENDTAPGNSVGINVYELEVVKKAQYEKDPETGRETLKSPAVMKATDWELLECSSVSIPANGNASSYSKEDNNVFSNSPKHVVRVIGDPGYKKLSSVAGEPPKNTGGEFKSEQPPVIPDKKTFSNFSKKSIKSKDGKMNFSEMSQDELIDYAVNADQKLSKLTETNENLVKEKATLSAQFTEANQKLQKIENDNRILTSYRDLFSQATKLNSVDAKLSKVELDKLFPGEQEFLALENPTMELGQIKYYLMACENRPAQLSTQLTAKTSIVDSPEVETDEDDDEYFEQLKNKKVVRSY